MLYRYKYQYEEIQFHIGIFLITFLLMRTKMKSVIKEQLVSEFKKMLMIIENDKDYLGNFFKEGQIEINLERVFKNNTDVTTSDQYNFILSQSFKDNVSLEIESGTKTQTVFTMQNDETLEEISKERELDINFLLDMEK